MSSKNRSKLLIVLTLFIFITVIFSEKTSKGDIDQFDKLSKRIYSLEKDTEFLKIEIKLMKDRYNVTVTVTAYCSCEDGTDNTPYITSALKRPKKWTAAVSPYLYWIGWTEGKYIYVDQMGRFQILDKMNWRYKERDSEDKNKNGLRIDLYFPTKKAAKKFGVKENINVALMEIKNGKYE